MKTFFRLATIIGNLPITLQNGTTADATQVMSDLNFIVNQVNANAAPLANTALTNVNNNFTAVQSGIAASAAANFTIASQVQNSNLQNLTSTLGTNAITARCAALPLTTYATGQVFRFIPSQTNTGPANITVDAAGSTIIFSAGSTLIGGELTAGVPAEIFHDGSKANIIGPLGVGPASWTPTDASGAGLVLTVSDAFFVRSGKMVTLIFNITYPATGSGATAKIGGLPANPKSLAGVDQIFPLVLANNLDIVARLDNTGSSATMTFALFGTTATPLTNSQMTTNTISGTFTYISA